MLWREGRGALRYYRRARPANVLGLAGMTGSPMLVFAGLSITRAEHGAIIVSLQPSVTATADWWLRGRRPARFTRGWIAAAFAGVVLVVTKGDPAFALELAGAGLVIGALVANNLYLRHKRAVKKAVPV